MNKRFASLVFLLWLFATLAVGRAQNPAETAALPERPAQFFNDFALTTRSDTRETLNHRLADFERQTSNQILVAVFPKLPDGAEVADYAQKVFRAWQPGQAGRDNGAILFVFVQNRKLRIQTGRGLEGALPDATCRRIIAEQIAPRFKANDYDGGLTAGVDAILTAARGEYQGTGRTVSEGKRQNNPGDTAIGFGLLLSVLYLFLIFVALPALGIFMLFRRFFQRGRVYGGGGYRNMNSGGGPILLPMGGGGFGGGGGGSGGGWGGGGGGSNDSFSSGGGDSGGGGASGDW